MKLIPVNMSKEDRVPQIAHINPEAIACILPAHKCIKEGDVEQVPDWWRIFFKGDPSNDGVIIRQAKELDKLLVLVSGKYDRRVK